MIDFLLRINGDGSLSIFKLATEEVERTNIKTDAGFQAARLNVDDRIDLHVNTGTLAIDGRPMDGERRLLSVSLFEDEVPRFSSPEEADQWMSQRASR